MFLLFLAIWIIYNGQLTIEILLFGLVISAAAYLFICKFLGYSVKKDLFFMKSAGLILDYIFVLIIEIIKANFVAMKYLTTNRYELEPVIVTFHTDLQSNVARVILANSITLTPGTITVSLVGDEYQVHCLDKELAQGMDSSIFVKKLRRIEGLEACNK